jgi:site-specific recombinase XerD
VGIPDIRRRDLIAAFLAGRKSTTHRAYESDLRDFAAWSGHPTPQAAADWLFGLTPGEANHAVLTYRAELAERQLSAATIARRIGTLRSMSKVARLTGVCSWSLEVEAPAVEPYRDTAGPGGDGFRRMLEVARTEANHGGGRQRRDLALLRVLHDLGLRRAEASGLDLVDIERTEDGTPAALWIHGKGPAAFQAICLRNVLHNRQVGFQGIGSRSGEAIRAPCSSASTWGAVRPGRMEPPGCQAR